MTTRTVPYGKRRNIAMSKWLEVKRCYISQAWKTLLYVQIWTFGVFVGWSPTRKHGLHIEWLRADRHGWARWMPNVRMHRYV